MNITLCTLITYKTLRHRHLVTRDVKAYHGTTMAAKSSATSDSGDADPLTRPQTTVSAVSIKLPPFWPNDPEVWFAQVEAQFATRGVIVQKTRFDYVISSLNPEFALEVRDLILNPPTETPYDSLKNELVKRTTASEQRKLQQLISGEELGDRKPTQLLRQMQQLLGDRLSASADAASFFRELFLQRLPANIRMVLASTDSTMDINKLADMADKVIEVSAPSVSAITSSAHSTDVKELREEVARLTDLVASLTTGPYHSRRRSTPRPRRSQSPAPTSASPAQDSLCWYHRRFGDKAKNCHDPCSWENSPAGR